MSNQNKNSSVTFTTNSIIVDLANKTPEQLADEFHRLASMFGKGKVENKPDTICDDIINANSMWIRFAPDTVSVSASTYVYMTISDPLTQIGWILNPIFHMIYGFEEGSLGNANITISNIINKNHEKVYREKLEEIEVYNLLSNYYKSAINYCQILNQYNTSSQNTSNITFPYHHP